MSSAHARAVLRQAFGLSRRAMHSTSVKAAAAVTLSSKGPISRSRNVFAPAPADRRGITEGARTFHSSSFCRKEIDFLLADIGEGITEVEVVQWFVSEGDQVEEFDKLCEVQSDKANVEISSRYTGKITSLCWEQGTIAKVGEPLVRIDVEGEVDAAPAAEQAEEPAKAEPKKQQQAEPSQVHEPSSVAAGSSSFINDGPILTTPAVRRIAKENNVDLRTVKGTGKNGRILKEDMIAYLEGGQQSSTVSAPAVAAPAAPLPFAREAQDVEVPIRGYTRAMIKTMTVQATVPHFGYCDEISMDEVAKLRATIKPIAEAQGIKLSYMPIIMKAMSLALLDYPQLNAKISEDFSALVHKASHNIGIAMDTPTGLVVPNVKNCEQRSFLEIASELSRLMDNARDGKVATEDLTGGTFSLSNIGAIGGTYASPVLMPSEIAIGALGKLSKEPRFDQQGNVVASTVMRVSWSADHRVVDGATMARFSNAFKGYLEDPVAMLMRMR